MSGTARPIRRLQAVAIVWWVLGALPLLVAMGVKWLSVTVGAAVVIRMGLGVFAWLKAAALQREPGARLGAARVVFLLAPLVLFAGGVAIERTEVRPPPGEAVRRDPSFCLPEMRLPRRGDMDARPWFGDRDNPEMAVFAGMLVALGLGIAILVARRSPASPTAPTARPR